MQTALPSELAMFPMFSSEYFIISRPRAGRKILPAAAGF